MNFHAASSEVTFNFDILVVGRGIIFKEENIPRWCLSCIFHVFVL